MTNVPTSRRRATFAALGLLTALCSCDRDEPPSTAPARSAPSSACASPARVNDSASAALLPRRAGGYCVDPAGSDRAYGEGSQQGIDGICDLFDGECETYKRFGVRRLVEARYVAASGEESTIDVYLSRYASSKHAYAMFSHRVVGDDDPARTRAPRPLEVRGAGALGLNNAIVWRGAFLVELTYSDPSADVKALEQKASAALPPLVAALDDKLAGTTDPPAAVRLLPTEHRLPLGVRYQLDGVLGIEGAGSGAYGYYRQGERRWRVLGAVRPEPASARDLLRTIAALPGATEQKNLGDGAVRVVHQMSKASPQTEWIAARQGSRVIAVGDEERIFGSGQSSEERQKRALSTDEKRALLGRLLGELKKPPTSASGP